MKIAILATLLQTGLVPFVPPNAEIQFGTPLPEWSYATTAFGLSTDGNHRVSNWFSSYGKIEPNSFGILYKSPSAPPQGYDYLTYFNAETYESYTYVINIGRGSSGTTDGIWSIGNGSYLHSEMPLQVGPKKGTPRDPQRPPKTVPRWDFNLGKYVLVAPWEGYVYPIEGDRKLSGKPEKVTEGNLGSSEVNRDSNGNLTLGSPSAGMTVGGSYTEAELINKPYIMERVFEEWFTDLYIWENGKWKWIGTKRCTQAGYRLVLVVVPPIITKVTWDPLSKNCVFVTKPQ